MICTIWTGIEGWTTVPDVVTLQVNCNRKPETSVSYVEFAKANQYHKETGLPIFIPDLLEKYS